MSIKTVRNIRRLSQLVFFFIFFFLILKTNFEVDFSPENVDLISLPYPVSIALQFDPLVALTTLLASGTLFKGLLWSLVILIPTIFLGRFFCGWICPLGTLNHWISEIKSERLTRKGKFKIESNKYRKYQRLKYYIFLAFCSAALLGSLQLTILDPLPLLARSLGTAVLPTIHTAANGLVDYIKSIGWPPLGNAAQAVYNFVAPYLFIFREAHFHTIISIGLFFIIILALNRLFTRFWCRAICPLGAMLGIFSRYSIFGLQKEESSCDHCNLCLHSCQGADNPNVGEKWRKTECHLCLNCQAACPQGSLKFKFFPNQEITVNNPAPVETVDITRRKVTLSAAAGLAAVPLMRAGDAFEANSNPSLIRPPGALGETDFIERCIRCGQCMRVCPNNALHPTFSEAGFEGIWTPFMIPRIGYCEPTCTLCGQVCPTGAINELTALDKVGNEKQSPVRIGTAFINQGRCLPWAMDTSCIVCEEWCPTSPKSIFLKEENIINRKGEEITLKRPFVDPELCTGCGACEYACPVTVEPAVHVLAIGETRAPEKQMILQRDLMNKNLPQNNRPGKDI